eukprot:gene4724-8308_t
MISDGALVLTLYFTYFTASLISRTYWKSAMFLSLIGLIYPWFIQDIFFKFVFGMSSIFLILRNIELMEKNEEIPWWYRLAHISLFINFKNYKKESRNKIAIKIFSQFLIWIPIQLILLNSLELSKPFRMIHWLNIFGLFLSGMYITDAIFRSIPMLFGIETKSIMNSPLLSISISEFWSNRWNSIIRNSLATVIYKPLAKRNQKDLGLALTFLFSGLYHVYPIFLISNHDYDAFLNSLMMMGFFVVHLIIIQFEKKLNLHGRFYVYTVFFLTIPLFVEPIVKILNF